MNKMAFYRRPLPYGFYNITLVLIVVNVGFFLLRQIDPRTVYFYLSLIPQLVVQNHFWWQVVTYMFVHANTAHIFFNMLALFLFGSQVEHRMGSWEFLLFYMVSGVGAGLFTLAVYWFTGMQHAAVVGASGAIFGLLLAFATFFPNAIIFAYFIPMRAKTAVLVFAGIAIIFQLTGANRGVANLTHLAGLLFGYLHLRIRLGIDPIDAFRR